MDGKWESVYVQETHYVMYICIPIPTHQFECSIESGSFLVYGGVCVWCGGVRSGVDCGVPGHESSRFLPFKSPFKSSHLIAHNIGKWPVLNAALELAMVGFGWFFKSNAIE